MENPDSPSVAPTRDIQEILRLRREMLDRVRKDLNRVDALQKEISGQQQQGAQSPENPKQDK
jgi:hypothetical protein